VSTLQIVIEGTGNYNASSGNPLNNRKIQSFNFQSLVSAYDAAGRPSNFSIANNLAAHRIGGSDTAAIGGAAAYQYARTGTLGTLSYAQLHAVINDPAFAVGTQSITPSAAASAEVSALNEASTPFSVDSSVESTSRTAASLVDPADEIASQKEKPVSPGAAAIASATGTDTGDALADGDVALATRSARPHDEGSSAATSALTETESSTLITQWFEGMSRNEDLSLLDDILRGDDAIAPRDRSAIAAEWERSHHWLSRNVDARLDDSVTSGDGTGSAAFSYFGMDQLHEAPRAPIGLAGVAGHEMTVFRGLPA
jgi:hypothetical protein